MELILMPLGPLLSIILSFLRDSSISPIDRLNRTLFHNLLLIVVVGTWSRVAIVDTFGESIGLPE